MGQDGAEFKAESGVASNETQNITTEDDEEEDICPVCLLSKEGLGTSEFFARGACGHTICMPCCERVLRTTTSSNENDDDAHLAASTMGRCPICRATIDLFELVDADWDAESAKSPPYLVVKDYDIANSPIGGFVYTMDGKVGLASFHFPPPSSALTSSLETSSSGKTNSQNSNRLPVPTNTNEGEAIESLSECDEWEKDSHGRILPYIMFGTSTLYNLKLYWMMDDVSTPPSRQYFQEGCHFHHKTRTFHGRFMWSKSVHKSWEHFRTVMDVVMEFSPDYRYVKRGIMTQHRQLSPEVSPRPLDGRWLIKWVDDNHAQRMHVIGGVLVQGQFQYKIDIDRRDVDNVKISFRWPSGLDEASGTTQHVVSGVDLAAKPNGPDIGAVIEWETNTRAKSRIQWIRESIGGVPPPITRWFGPTGLFYRRLGLTEDESMSRPQYHNESIWGNVFIQSFRVGLASYHFINEGGTELDGAFISYENPLCSNWPPLDDGSPVPGRVPFSNIEWDPSTRTFQGTIEWKNRYDTTWQGCTKWRYKMVFDTEYICILSGSVKSSHESGSTERDMSTFGDSLIYVNAACFDKFSALLMSREASQNGSLAQPMNVIETRDQYRSLSNDLRRRLNIEGASADSIFMVDRLLASAAIRPSPNPIDFNT